MKQETTPIKQFIEDYQLDNPSGIICFKAMVHFDSEIAEFRFKSQVQIITIAYKHLDVIYLLNPDIDEKKIKTMFTNNQRFKYKTSDKFEIKGKSKIYGYYSIFIIPMNKRCEEETFAEVNARMNN